jgi:hypothetical protein
MWSRWRKLVSFAFGFIDDVTGGLGDDEFLRIHFVFGKVFYLNRVEGSQTYVQGDFGKLDAFDFEAFHQMFGEVQTGSRSSNGTFFFGVNRLVTLGIFLVDFAADVFWDRRFTELCKLVAEFIVRTVVKETKVLPREVVLSITSATSESSSPK